MPSTPTPSRIPTLLFLACTALLPQAITYVDAAKNSSYCAVDPYANPRADVCNPLRYIPTLWVAALALSLYFVTSILLTIQFWRHGRGKWFLCLIIGGYCEAFGLLMRIPFRTNPHSTGIYIVEYLFVVLSPCAFLAGDYIVFGRLVQMLDGQRHVPIRADRIMRFFVASDITTFLIQAAGGGLSTAQNAKSQKTGGDIFLAGIALQMVSFAFFTGLYLWFGFRCYTRDKFVWNAPGWKPLYWALGWTCIGFLIRSVYRTIELSQGYTGYLNTHEPWFYIFDTVSLSAAAEVPCAPFAPRHRLLTSRGLSLQLPLWLAISAYVPFYPGKYLKPEHQIVRPDGDGYHGSEMKESAAAGVGGVEAGGAPNAAPPMTGEDGMTPVGRSASGSANSAEKIGV